MNRLRTKERDEEIRKRWKKHLRSALGMMTMESLAKEYGVSKQRIYQVLKGATKRREYVTE